MHALPINNIHQEEGIQRQLIAYEIHDGIAQYISAAIMQLEASKQIPLMFKEDKDSNVNEALRLWEASQETRRLIRGLRPQTLDDLGIIGSLEALLQVPARNSKMSPSFITLGATGYQHKSRWCCFAYHRITYQHSTTR